MSRRQGIFWILTIPAGSWSVPAELPAWAKWIRGQREIGESGYEHWQLLVAFSSKCSLAVAKSWFTVDTHLELTRSSAAADYVWKDATAVSGSRFELGAKPIQRNSAVEWESVWLAAVSGDLQSIPANIRVVSYRTIRAIGADHDKPKPMLRECYVFHGPTGTGKSRRAWDEGGLDAYCKDPRTKFWCGYQGESNIIIDEFRGGIDIAHLLRWLDRYPVRVEIKGSSRPLCATKIWITSNLIPDLWYPEADHLTVAALMRRLTVTEFT